MIELTCKVVGEYHASNSGEFPELTMKTIADQLLELLAQNPDREVSEQELSFDFNDSGVFHDQMQQLQQLVKDGKVICVPLLAGTSGYGGYVLPDSPLLPQLIKLHAEWNAKHPEQAKLHTTATAFGEKQDTGRLFVQIWQDESHSVLKRQLAQFQPYTAKMQLEDFGHLVTNPHTSLVTIGLSPEDAQEYDRRSRELRNTRSEN